MSTLSGKTEDSEIPQLAKCVLSVSMRKREKSILTEIVDWRMVGEKERKSLTEMY